MRIVSTQRAPYEHPMITRGTLEFIAIFDYVWFCPTFGVHTTRSVSTEDWDSLEFWGYFGSTRATLGEDPCSSQFFYDWRVGKTDEE